MAVFRVNKTKDFTVMSNHHLKNAELSLKAKGLLSQILSLPDDWNYSIEGLAAINKESRSAIKSALKELSTCGYIVITKLLPSETASGRIEYLYNVYEVPAGKQATKKQGTENQPLENQPLEILAVENRTQLNTKDKRTNNKNTKDECTKECKKPIPFEPIIEYLNEKAGTSYRPTTPKTQALIRARYKEGFNLNDFRQVIDTKVKEWDNDSKMCKYLRPETLFGTKFESYLNQQDKQSKNLIEVLPENEQDKDFEALIRSFSDDD